jgi:RIO kinase 1
VGDRAFKLRLHSTPGYGGHTSARRSATRCDAKVVLSTGDAWIRGDPPPCSRRTARGSSVGATVLLAGRAASRMELARMRMPESLAALVDYGIVQEVIRPLMSGKEAEIYLVVSEGEERVAKVYKEANARTFKHRAEYTEGRKIRNTRDQRAMNKRSRHGKAQDEAAWRSTEASMMRRLRDAGVRVPEVYNFIEGVLLMEFVKDDTASAAPRLGDLTFEPGEALALYDELIAQVVRMLCAGVVHGDLSAFNVLMAADGPMLIDFPQSVDPAVNQGARRLLLRDVSNLHSFLERFAPSARRPLHGEEMWELYEGNRLTPTTRLRGAYQPSRKKADTSEVLTLIRDADAEEMQRRVARGEAPESSPHGPRRRVVDMTGETTRKSRPRPAEGAGSRVRSEKKESGSRRKAGGRKRTGAKQRGPGRSGQGATSSETRPAQDATAPSGRTRRRRRRPARSKEVSENGAAPASRGESPDRSRASARPAREKDGAAAGAKPRDPASKSDPATKKRTRRRRRPSRPR